MDNKNESSEKEEPILTVIQGIRDGTVKPRMLAKEVRQACIEALLSEGYSEIQVAQILQRCEKTIQRDIQVIREKNALIPSLEFAKQLVGDILRKGIAHHDYLVRLSNSGSASDSDKIQARASAWSIMSDLVEKLQSLGYLPSRPTTIVGDIFYHKEGADTNSVLDDINKQIIDVEGMMTETNVITQAVKEEIKQVKAIVDEVKATKDAKKEAPNDNINKQ